MMMKKFLTPAIFALMSAGQVQAGPLINALDSIVSDFGTFSWAEEYEFGNEAGLKGVTLQHVDGHEITVDRIDLKTDGAYFDIKLEGARLTPTDDVLLLRAKNMNFFGGPEHIKALLSLSFPEDACRFLGPEARLSIDDLGVILPMDGILEEDVKYRGFNIDLRQRSSGAAQNCRSAYTLDIGDFTTDYGGGKGLGITEFQAAFEMPGSLASLATDPNQTVSLTLDASRSASRISGGALAWSFETGDIDAEFAAMSLVPVLTHYLRETKSGQSKGWMGYWNQFEKITGNVSYVFQNATSRTANVVPGRFFAGFRDAGLTTLLFEAEGEIDAKSGNIDANLMFDMTGVMMSRIETEFSMDTYPDSVIVMDPKKAPTGTYYPPVKIKDFVFEMTDDGIIDAAGAMLGVPLTVRISQLRTMLQQTDDEAQKRAAVIMATEAAKFAANSYKNPPARFTGSMTEELNLREAIIISARSIPEILNIFSFEIGSGPRPETAQ